MVVKLFLSDDINTRRAKAWSAIERLSVKWKSDLYDKMKQFFQAAFVFILQYGCMKRSNQYKKNFLFCFILGVIWGGGSLFFVLFFVLFFFWGGVGGCQLVSLFTHRRAHFFFQVGNPVLVHHVESRLFCLHTSNRQIMPAILIEQQQKLLLSSRGVVANVVDCHILVSKFELQSRYCFHFWIHTLRKCTNLCPQLWIQLYYYCSLTRMAFALNNP